jgi:hypothetical protein
MLGALCELHNETECAIMQRLFHMGNVNAKAVNPSSNTSASSTGTIISRDEWRIGEWICKNFKNTRNDFELQISNKCFF